jgi:aminoglycoside 3-N-acetyltransferase I
MTYSFRRLTANDVPLLKQLLTVFGQAFNEPDTYQGDVPRDSYLGNLLGKENFIVLVAIDEHKVVGGLTAYILDKFEKERKEIYIYYLAILENYRRQGIATKLIFKLKQISQEQGAYVIFVQADRGDMAAISLYKSLGTSEETYNFDIPVN